ncbi:hypothetical protein BDW68DRAFT_48371 [Aspergillus falconensis]
MVSGSVLPCATASALLPCTGYGMSQGKKKYWRRLGKSHGGDEKPKTSWSTRLWKPFRFVSKLTVPSELEIL